MSKSGALVLLASAAMVAGPAAAQTTAPPVPAPAGSVPSREQVEQPAPDGRDRPRLRIDAQRAIASAPCPLRSSDLKVSINRLTFTGPGGAPLAPEIQALVGVIAPPAGGEREIAVVCDLRDTANIRLQRAGYIASVQIPPQAIETGELKLEVITAKIIEVRVRGDAPPYRRTLEGRAELLKSLDPLNQRDAERILLAASDIPGLDVQLSLSPAGTKVGEVIGELTVIYRPYSVIANVNNAGSRELGREIGYARVETYGLLGNQDVTYFGASASRDLKEQRVLQFGHGGALGFGGTRFEGSVLHAWSRPNLEQIDIRSKSLIAALVLTKPLIRARRTRLDVGTGFEFIEQRTRVYNDGDSSALNRDKLRIAFARVDGEMRNFSSGGGDAWSLLASLELRQGLSVFGATKAESISPSGYTPSRFQGDPTAFVARSGLDGLINFGSRLGLHGRVRGQWAQNPVLNFEEFSLGTLTVGRGYDPGSNSGDRALALRVEPRLMLWQSNAMRLDSFAFGDRVYLWNLDPNALENKRRIDSVGGGLRALFQGFGYAEVMYARPLDKVLLVPDAKRAPARLLISITAQFPRGGR